MKVIKTRNGKGIIIIFYLQLYMYIKIITSYFGIKKNKCIYIFR